MGAIKIEGRDIKCIIGVKAGNLHAKLGRIGKYQLADRALSKVELDRLPRSNRTIEDQSGVVRDLERPRSRDAAANFNYQRMTGLGRDGSVVLNGTCYDRAETYQRAGGGN